MGPKNLSLKNDDTEPMVKVKIEEDEVYMQDELNNISFDDEALLEDGSEDEDNDDDDDDEEWKVNAKNETKVKTKKHAKAKSTKDLKKNGENSKTNYKKENQDDFDDEEPKKRFRKRKGVEKDDEDTLASEDNENRLDDSVIDNLIKLINEEPTLSFRKIFLKVQGLAHLLARKSKCLTCNVTFKNREGHITHVIQHARGPNTFVCEKCGYTCNSLPCFRNHILDIHTILDILCPDCGDHFSDGAKYKQHKRMVHKPEISKPVWKEKKETHVCEICSVQCSSKSSITNHIRMQHGNPKIWTCGICASTFKSNAHYQTHIVLHEAPKIQCTQCGRKFHNEARLERHVLAQHRPDEEMNHQCTQCGKGFMEAVHLEGHMNMHLGLKPHKCRYCSNCYQNRSNCYAHEKKSHPDLFTRNTQVLTYI